MKIQITNKKEIEKAIGALVNDKVLPRVLKVAQLELQDNLQELLIDSFERTLVVRALQLDFIGDEQKDVPAHLGLSDSDSVDAAFRILEAVRTKFVFNRIQKIDNGAIGFRVSTNSLLEEIRGIAGTESDIPWMDWLIDGGSADAEIWFVKRPLSNADGDDYSRSGRAVMREFGGSGFWDIDSYHRFVEGDNANNFIEEAIGDEKWRNQARDMIFSFIADYFKTKRIKI